jgi:hypothetical protein
MMSPPVINHSLDTHNPNKLTSNLAQQRMAHMISIWNSISDKLFSEPYKLKKKTIPLNSQQ